MKKINWKLLIGSVVTIELLSWFVSWLSGDIQGVYNNLQLPKFAPPNWLFGVVWPILYLMMGVSLYLIIEAKGDYTKKKAYSVFALQLLLNFTWTIIFFRFQWYWTAFFVIVALNVFIWLTIWLFYKLNKTAAWLLIPYGLWVIFASFLNYAIAYIN